MKRFFFFLAAVASLSGCRTRLFPELPAVGNEQPVVPALLQPGANRLFLTDYFPQWERADSVTSATLRMSIIPI